MYLQTYFSNVINGVNMIYSKFDDPLISFQVEMAKFSIDEHNQIKTADTDDINEYFYKYYQKNQVDCDHIFFVLNFTKASKSGKLGEAFVNDICHPDHFTSIAQLRGDNMETTLAHELAHNLGVAVHDNDHKDFLEKCVGYLVGSTNENVYKSPNGWQLSPCSIDLIKTNLLNEKNELKENFTCLKKDNKVVKLKTIADSNYLSLSDQCRFYMEDLNSFCCQYDPGDMCQIIICYISEFHNCTSFRSNYQKQLAVALDGTSCGIGKECHFGKCVSAEKKKESNSNKFRKSADLLREKCPGG